MDEPEEVWLLLLRGNRVALLAEREGNEPVSDRSFGHSVAESVRERDGLLPRLDRDGPVELDQTDVEEGRQHADLDALGEVSRAGWKADPQPFCNLDVVCHRMPR